MTGELVRREALPETQKRRMFALLAAHFQESTPERFAADLAEKNWVVLIRDDAGAVAGFSTLLFYRAAFESRELAVVYSGDTIMTRGAWNSPALPRTWVRNVLRLHAEQCPALPFYWLLLTSGFRTYRFLSVFMREFWPRATVAMPAETRQLRDHLAQQRFGDRYDAARGIARLGQPLSNDLLEVPAGKRDDADVAFFLKQNPGYVRGDELVCITPMSLANLTPAGRRMAGE